MPSAKTTKGSLNEGDEVEARVAQLWYWEGYFARSGVDLKRHYQPEPLLVTDLDLLAFDFSPSLRRSKTIGETKTGAAKPLDRIIWIRGLMALVGADHAEVVSKSAPSRRARDLARGLGVRAQSTKDVERRELAVDVAAVAELGSHGATAVVERTRVHKHCSKDADLERAFWFLRSEVWFLDEVTAAKRLIGTYRVLSKRWTPYIDDEDSSALRWLLAETVSAFTLNAVAIAADAITDDADLFRTELSERLSGGVVPAAAMRRIAIDVDRFVAGLLSATNAPASLRVDAMGALQPEPPEWTDSLIELVHRLAMSPAAAQALPRQMDLLIFERLVWRRQVPLAAVQRLELDSTDAGRLIRLVAAFLRTYSAPIDAVDKALTRPIPTTSVDAAPAGEVAEQAVAQELPIADSPEV